MTTILVPADDKVRYLSVADICALYGVRKSYVYKLACVHSWRRVKVSTSVRYHIEDIDDALGRDE